MLIGCSCGVSGEICPGKGRVSSAGGACVTAWVAAAYGLVSEEVDEVMLIPVTATVGSAAGLEVLKRLGLNRSVELELDGSWNGIEVRLLAALLVLVLVVVVVSGGGVEDVVVTGGEVVVAVDVEVGVEDVVLDGGVVMGELEL